MVNLWRKVCQLIAYLYPYIRAAYFSIGAFGIILLAYFLYDLHKPVITVISGKITNEVIHPGDKLRIDWNVMTHRQCYTEVNRHVAGRCGIFTLESYRGRFPGDAGKIQMHHIVVDLPKSVDTDTCNYHAEAYFYCNLLANVFPQLFIFPSLPFAITPEDK